MDFLDTKLMLKKLYTVFDSLRYAAGLKTVFSCWLEDVENGSCRFHYAHEIDTLLEVSEAVARKKSSH